jgi:hypothetical protein
VPAATATGRHQARVHRASRAGAHCQINNLRLAHLIIFDWLGRVFGYRNAAETATCAAA